VPRLSIVIPALRLTEAFEDTLASVLRNRPSACEVIVVHPQPYGDPYDLAGEVRFVEAPGRSSLAGLLRVGMGVARGQSIHVLQPGLEVTEGWTGPACRRLEADPRVGAVAPLVLTVGDRPRIVSAGIEYTTGGRQRRLAAGRRYHPAGQHRGRPTCPSLNAAFYRAVAVRQAHVWGDEWEDEWLDVQIGLSLTGAGYSCELEPQSVVYAMHRHAPGGGGFRAGRRAEQLFRQHAPRRGRLRSWLAHPAAILVEFLTLLPRPAALGMLAGRLSELCSAGVGARRMDRPQAAGEVRPHRPNEAVLPAHCRIDGAHHQVEKVTQTQKAVPPRGVASR